MNTRYAALCLDLDGTIVDPDGRVRESTRRSIARLREAGVRVMITTGRSVLGTEAIIDELELT
ncbi:MAG: HAD hydrolase family protein, partial [Planctomycetes bacterium]|nr:HAD hydrolase family protein [Planctomycetota bacterium]